MKVAIVGYGRMGREVEAVVADRGHVVVATVDPAARGPAGVPHAASVTPEILADAEVAIEFAEASGVVSNARAYAESGTAAVVGTTGWQDQFETVRRVFDSAACGAVAGSNFSVGAHLFFAVAAFASKLARNLEEYDLFIHEIHHKNKKDSPSGTALTLARKVMAEVVRKRTTVTDRLDRAPLPEELHVTSTRGGAVPGIHTLYLDSGADTIEIRHSARSRAGFALGAVRAAEWIVGKRGFFTVEDFIQSLLSSTEGGE